MRHALHKAAKKGKLDKVPERLITMKAILLKDEWGCTPLHWSANGGHLNQVPRELITMETMLVTNKNSNTPLHYAAESGHLDQVPQELLTLETLLTKNNDGSTPLHGAARHGHLDQLLGIDFEDSDEAEKIVGKGWWAKNKAHPKKVVYKFVQYSEEIDI